MGMAVAYPGSPWPQLKKQPSLFHGSCKHRSEQCDGSPFLQLHCPSLHQRQDPQQGFLQAVLWPDTALRAGAHTEYLEQPLT